MTSLGGSFGSYASKSASTSGDSLIIRSMSMLVINLLALFRIFM